MGSDYHHHSVALAFWQDILAFLIFMGICSGIGAIVFGVLFDNSELGGLVGAGFAAFIGLKRVMESLNADYANVMWFLYWLVSLPVYLLNKTQYVLSVRNPPHTRSLSGGYLKPQ